MAVETKSKAESGCKENVVKIAVSVMFKKHVYTFGGASYRQISGRANRPEIHLLSCKDSLG